MTLLLSAKRLADLICGLFRLKNIEQQDRQCLHRVRQRLVKNHTAIVNQIHGLAAEYGVALSEGKHKMLSEIHDELEDGSNGLSPIFRELLQELYLEFKDIDLKVKKLSSQITQLNSISETAQKLLTIPGVGPLSASVLGIELGDGTCFKNGRHFSSYLGLVPKERSSGGKVRLLGITKRGDSYLRGLLIHGARAVVYSVSKIPLEQCNRLQSWLKKLITQNGGLFLYSIYAFFASGHKPVEKVVTLTFLSTIPLTYLYVKLNKKVDPFLLDVTKIVNDHVAKFVNDYKH